MSGKSIISVSTAAPSSVGASSTRSVAHAGLGKLRAELPFAAIEQRKDAVHFGIHVTGLDGEAWRVWHRYEDFQQLQQRLGGADWSDAAFPARFRCFCQGQRQRTDDRRRGLEVWLTRAIQESSRREGWVKVPREAWVEALREFLRVPSSDKNTESLVSNENEGPRADVKAKPKRICSHISE